MHEQNKAARGKISRRTLLSLSISIALTLSSVPVLAANVDNTATVVSPIAKTVSPAKTATSNAGDTITVTASPTVFKSGGDQLVPAYLDGGFANGGRLGILGEQSAQNVPFSIVSYTSKLIQDQQSRTLGDVLNNDASVQTGYGYGNYAETFVIRGFPLDGEDIAYGGLYGILPRQVVPMELAERVELLKGSSAFLNGVPPGGTGVGGSVNIEPKHATDEPINRVSVDYNAKSQIGGALDVGRRFGDNNQFGVRVNMVHREGDTAIDNEKKRLTMGTVGLDYRSDRFHTSFDFGVTRQTIHGGRPVVYLGSATEIPDAPKATRNYGQKWAYTDMTNEFGLLKAEYDLSDNWTVYAAGGANHDHEDGIYSSPTLTDNSGDTKMSRMTVPYRADSIAGQAGIRGKFDTGFITHHVNLGVTSLYRKTRSAYTLSGTTISSNLYDPIAVDVQPTTLYSGGNMSDPGVTNRTRSQGVMLSDTLSVLDGRGQLIAGLRRQNVMVMNYNYDGSESSSFDQTKVTPAVGLVIKPWEHISFYANHIEALQAGETAGTTYGGVAVTNGGQVSGIETSKQNEVGVKADFGRVATSLALFEIKKPIGMYTLVGDSYTFGNYGEERNRGIEWNFFGEPVLGVRINGSATLMNPDVTKTQSGTYNGNDAVGVPRYQWVLGGEWDLPGLTGVTATSKLIRTGSQYADEANTLKVDAWTRLDVGLRYTMPLKDSTLTWRATVENVTNEKYWASATGGYLTQGDPREFKLSATYDF
ncbi:TonB-dependent siderophore receptor [Serratia sp. M24T3]|uniref:TonB-dependent receptor n=1 Tax=Serratia sp. M24T3 TaxID=932213 RepID=UPI00025BB929|nr:TonB-dependent siderophore receptor [Serratia sp. M24T3]EIC85020.1 TonB-dependent siderophore receptor [Serratia sp. M24T3]